MGHHLDKVKLIDSDLELINLIKFINANFLIRITHNFSDGTFYSFLIGAGQYDRVIGNPELVKKHFKKVRWSIDDKIVFKLRRGIVIEFVSR